MADFAFPAWAPEAPPPPPEVPEVDPHRIEGLVNGFIAAKQDVLFAAPDAFYRRTGADAVESVPAITARLSGLRDATLEQASDDSERQALGPRLDAHMADALDGIAITSSREAKEETTG